MPFATIYLLMVHFEYVRFHGPVLHDLGRQFDEISRDIGACQLLVRTIGQQAVQCMSEFVEQGQNFIKGQQGRFVRCRLREVPYIVNDGADVSPISFRLLAHFPLLVCG